jgi:hypothetical protein
MTFNNINTAWELSTARSGRGELVLDQVMFNIPPPISFGRAICSTEEHDILPIANAVREALGLGP